MYTHCIPLNLISPLISIRLRTQIVKILKDTNSIRQTHHLLYGGYMFRPFIGSSSGLFWNQVNECCVHVGIPTMLTNSRDVVYLTIELHKIEMTV